jgi:hypothetical protein
LQVEEEMELVGSVARAALCCWSLARALQPFSSSPLRRSSINESANELVDFLSMFSLSRVLEAIPTLFFLNVYRSGKGLRL